jgi:error-prone DNA polymerase
VDINYSYWDNILEVRKGKFCPVRLGFREVMGLNEEDINTLISARGIPYTNIPSLRDAGVNITALEKLADADAFRSIGLDRRQALWEVSAVNDRPTGMFIGQQPEIASEQGVQLPAMSLSEHVVQDYSAIGLSLKAHPVSFVREKLLMLQVTANHNLSQLKDGAIVKVAGLVLVRQRPGTASGIVFITIEDETGIANLVVFKKTFDKYRKEILQSRLLMVEGQLQVEGEVIHVVVKRCYNISGLLQKLTKNESESPALLTLSRADEKDTENYATQDKRVQRNTALQADIFHGGRNFK